jgi:hypothetical protein
MARRLEKFTTLIFWLDWIAITLNILRREQKHYATRTENHPMSANATTKRPPEIQRARNILRGKGWTITAAAPRLGVTYTHLSLVLNGHRESRRILKAIEEMPESPNPA